MSFLILFAFIFTYRTGKNSINHPVLFKMLMPIKLFDPYENVLATYCG